MMRPIHSILLTALACACVSNEQPDRPTGSAPISATFDSSDAGNDSKTGDAAAVVDKIKRSKKSSLQWKRYATFENDLASALELEPAALCKEFGTEDCIRGVHLGPLGGHDIRTGLLESPVEPLVTTPTVVERVVLSACLARIAKERSEGTKVFAGLDLAAAAPAPDSAKTREVVTALVRRFLARDPADEELEVLSALARGPQGTARPAAVFASSLCIAIGSSTEFLFF